MGDTIQLRDKWLRVTGIVGIWLLSLLAHPAYREPFHVGQLWRATITLAAIALCWECNRATIIRSKLLFNDDESTAKRLAFVFACGLLCTGAIVFCTRFVGTVVLAGLDAAIQENITDRTLSGVLKEVLLAPILLFSLFVGIYEAIYYRTGLKQSEAVKKRLEKEKAWSQLDSLHQQINPHFLFNTLNAISSVVTENPEEADKLLNETSKVYRYLLDFNNKDLVLLRDELRFIRSFFQLLQMRYGKGIALRCHRRAVPLKTTCCRRSRCNCW